MSTKQSSFNPNDYEPRKFGLKYDPPQIILEYFIPSMNKLKHHKIKLLKLRKDSKIEDILKEIYEKHGMYVDKTIINETQLVNLIEKLRSNLKSVKNNIVIENNIIVNKDGRNINFYEKEKEKEKVKDLSNDNIYENEYENYNEFDNDYTKFDSSEVDLNKLELEDINKIKSKMEQTFESHLIKPGDSNYQYDVRKDFSSQKTLKQNPEWDSFDIEDIEDERF